MKSIIKILMLAIAIGICWAGEQTVSDSAKSDSLKEDSTNISTKSKSFEKSHSHTKYDYFIDRNGDGIDDRLNKQSTDTEKSKSKSSSKYRSFRGKNSRSSSKYNKHKKNTSTTKSSRYRGK